MKACKNCRYIVQGPEKSCPKCEGELSERFSGMILVLDPEKSEIAKVAEINSIGSYAIVVK
jgi:DNA-directed RNA polymerase subunit E"